METDKEYKTKRWTEKIMLYVKDYVKTIGELKNLQSAMSSIFESQPNNLYGNIVHTAATNLMFPVQLTSGLFANRENFEKVLAEISHAHSKIFNSTTLPSKDQINDTFKYSIAELEKPAEPFLTCRDDIKNDSMHRAICYFLSMPSGANPIEKAAIGATAFTTKKDLLTKLPFALFELLEDHTTYQETQNFKDDKVLEAFFPTLTTPLRDTKYFPVDLFNMTQQQGCEFNNYKSFIMQQEANCFYNILVEANKSAQKNHKNPSVQRHISIRNRLLNQFYTCCVELKKAANIIKNSIDSTDNDLRKKAKARLESKKLIDSEGIIDIYPYPTLIAGDRIIDILIELEKVIRAHKKSKTRSKSSSKKEKTIKIPLSLQEELKQRYGKRPKWSVIVLESIENIKSFSKKDVAEESVKISFDKESIKAAYRKKPEYASITPIISDSTVKAIQSRAKKCGLNLQEYLNFALEYYLKNPSIDKPQWAIAKTGVEQFGLGKQQAIAASSDTQPHTESDISQVETTEQINATPANTIELSDTQHSLPDNEPQTESRATLQKNDLTDHEPLSSQEHGETAKTSLDLIKLEAQFESVGFSVKTSNRKRTR